MSEELPWTVLPPPSQTKEEGEGHCPVVLGESPVWSSRTGCLYWVDIDGRRVHRSHVASGVTDSVQLAAQPGAIGLVAGHAHWTWVATAEGVLILDWTSLQSACVAASPAPATHRFNDGKVDPHGDLVIGTMLAQSDAKLRKGAGKLWRIALPRIPSVRPAQQQRQAAEVHCLVEGATIPNGLDWDVRAVPPSLYWIDTPLKRVDCLEFTSEAANTPIRRSAFSTVNLRTPTGDLIGGEPDGLTRDREGMLWIAMPGGSCVCRLSPSGELLNSFRLPVSKVSSLCFGGPSMRDLFVTSVSKGVDRAKEPLAGRVFVLRNVGAQGTEAHKLQADFHQLRLDFAERRFGVVTQHRLLPAQPLSTPTTLASSTSSPAPAPSPAPPLRAKF